MVVVPSLLRQRVQNGALHVVEWRRLAGPDFKLSHALMNEHLVASDHMNVARTRHFYQLGFEGRIDHLKQISGAEFILIQRSLRFSPLHPHGSRINVYVKVELWNLLA